MITLFRAIRAYQLKLKYQLAILQFVDKYVSQLIKNPEEIEKKFVSAFAELLNNTNKENNS